MIRQYCHIRIGDKFILDGATYVKVSPTHARLLGLPDGEKAGIQSFRSVSGLETVWLQFMGKGMSVSLRPVQTEHA